MNSFILRWYQNITSSFSQFIAEAFHAAGVLWLMTEVISFFNDSAKHWLDSQGLLFLGFSLSWAVIKFFPRKSYQHRLANRDVVIEIQVANAFDLSGALVVPINTTFDTDLNGHISRANSIQGVFLKRYYANNLNLLDSDIESALSHEGYEYETITDKTLGKKQKYKIGDVIKLRTNTKLFYLLPASHITYEGRAFGTQQDTQIALIKLWKYISEKGDKGDVVVPVIGTGHARVTAKREDVFKQIVVSFIKSSMAKKYCDKLTIAIYPDDIVNYDINIQELNNFLKYACEYSELWHVST